MKIEKINDYTTLSEIEPSDTYGWDNCYEFTFRLNTLLKTKYGFTHGHCELFKERPTDKQIQENEQMTRAEFARLHPRTPLCDKWRGIPRLR